MLKDELMLKAACRHGYGWDVQLWSSDDPLAKSVAVHVCLNHCPALKPCTALRPVQGMVLAGVAYSDSPYPIPMVRQPRVLPRCSACVATPPGGVLDSDLATNTH